MVHYTLRSVQKIPVSLEKAWDFFSRPDGLKIITPENIGFKLLNKPEQEKLYAGQILEYRVAPIWRIPLYWKTEITVVQDNKLFIDEQRKGPYRLWHHEHYFKAIDGGVEMTDIVHYRNPFGVLGRWVNDLFVKKRLLKIFQYRHNKIEELFGKWPGQACTIEFL